MHLHKPERVIVRVSVRSHAELRVRGPTITSCNPVKDCCISGLVWFIYPCENLCSDGGGRRAGASVGGDDDGAFSNAVWRVRACVVACVRSLHSEEYRFSHGFLNPSFRVIYTPTTSPVDNGLCLSLVVVIVLVPVRVRVSFSFLLV